ncbi:putative bifunctional diguanylate cyclase/phosphodiesterase [Deinococcus hopiensis]|uniref:putative bifunctional diguanylate cyclase/phosphodiesterase n=1 Tax=Deinococcus hopiensis TaxID=309885 RepID=UPI0009FD4F8D|nr:EAL domain-containing protein [Deinococcus hopiensis]
MSDAEHQRLAALYRYEVLGSPPDEALDRLARMGQSVLGVPIVIINLVAAHSTWFKSSVGTHLQGLRREDACCGWAIESSGAFTVPDIQADPRFQKDRMLTAEHARAYAGAPLITPDGQRIGAFAVFDLEVRTFTSEELGLLMDLAAVVMDELELRLTALHWREAQERSAYLAHHDALTGLPNRLRFFDRAEQALRQAERLGHPAAVMMLDLNGFKRINDSLGHAVGDGLLKAVGERLCEVVRSEDTVARFGGDEFAILLPELREPLAAMQVATKLLEAFDRPFALAQQAVRTRASLGISLYPHDGVDAAALLLAADTAMYSAKASPHLRYCFYSEAMSEAAQAKLRLQGQLRSALERGQLRLHYQPQVNLRTGKVVGFEALVRWPRADGSWARPEDFIPVAEESGLIVALGEWTLREACTQLVAWLNAGAPVWDLSINVSARQWESAGFLDMVRRTLRETGCPPERLLLEVTESALLSELSAAPKLTQQLCELGVRTALDDFGTQFSNLSQLQHLDVHQLKVDRSFTRGVPTVPKALALASTVITLGHSLGIPVVGEGVETEAQRATLKGLGCDLAQGFLFARPLPPREVEKLFLGGS